MQNAKDTFYVTLRNRLALVNPNRTMLLRGVQRPGILVEEAEAVVPMLPADIFVLRWTAFQTDVNLPLLLARMECEIHYTTGGTQAAAGLDRGRALEEMDAEVLAVLSPTSTPKMNYAASPAQQLSTPVFWTAAEFTPAITARDRLTRNAKILGLRLSGGRRTMSTATVTYSTPTTPATRRVRAYFAPVNRVAGQPTVFDPSVNGGFNLDSPPAPWTDLGWITNFSRRSASTINALNVGSPAAPQVQMRELIGAGVEFRFLSWRKLSMALSAGSEHMNLLAPAVGAAANGSGGHGAAAVTLAAGSTAISLNIPQANLAGFSAGQMVVVDLDYVNQIGYVGSGVSAAYVRSASSVNGDPDYVRRVSYNVARVASVGASFLTLAQPLLAGAPLANMRVQQISGFVDREGGSFFQEWSALFVMPGEQGDRILYYYPRLQPTGGAQEDTSTLSGPIEWVALNASFRAMPVIDANDGEQALCFRSFLPSPGTLL